MVVYHRRSGGQSQFSALQDLAPDSERIRVVLEHIRGNLGAALTVEHLADVACVSPRQFLRSFKAETGETPAKAVERIRAEAARARTSRRAPTVSTASRDGQALPTANGCGGPSCVSTASRRRRCGAWPGKDKKRALFLSLMTPARKARHPAGTACKTKMGIEL